MSNCRSTRLFAAILALVAAAAVYVAPAFSAGRAIHVSGSYGVLDFGTPHCVPNAHNPALVTCRITGFKSSYDGDLVGSSTIDFVQTIDCAAGRTWGFGIETFSGDVNQQGHGTLTWALAFNADFDCVNGYPFNFVGLATIVRSSGGLAGTSGTLHFGDTDYDGILR